MMDKAAHGTDISRRRRTGMAARDRVVAAARAFPAVGHDGAVFIACVVTRLSSVCDMSRHIRVKSGASDVISADLVH